MTGNDIKQAVTPLRLIFWGALLCIFDLTFSQTVNGRGTRFDVLNDALGTILIAVGVFRLRPAPVRSPYAAVMKFVCVVSVLAVLDAIREHFITPLPEPVQFALNVFQLVTLAAIVAFCIAMRWFCEEANLDDAARSWTVTTVLFVVIYAIPLGLFYVIGAIAVVSGTSFHVNLGPAGLLLVVVFVIPVIHLFISTSRMKRAAEALPPL